MPGEDGEDGAPGSNQINPALIYPVIGTLSSGTSEANCESGDVVLGGQFQIASGAGHSMGEITNLRAGSSGSGGYSVSIQTLSGSIQGVQANAICFDNPPLNTFASPSVATFQQPKEHSPTGTTTQSNNPITSHTNNPITTQSNNIITNPTTTQSSGVGEASLSSNTEAAGLNTFSSSTQSFPLLNILPSNLN